MKLTQIIAAGAALVLSTAALANNSIVFTNNTSATLTPICSGVGSTTGSATGIPLNKGSNPLPWIGLYGYLAGHGIHVSGTDMNLSCIFSDGSASVGTGDIHIKLNSNLSHDDGVITNFKNTSTKYSVTITDASGTPTTVAPGSTYTHADSPEDANTTVEIDNA
jgi:hypothetical protein